MVARSPISSSCYSIAQIALWIILEQFQNGGGLSLLIMGLGCFDTKSNPEGDPVRQLPIIRLNQDLERVKILEL